MAKPGQVSWATLLQSTRVGKPMNAMLPAVSVAAGWLRSAADLEQYQYIRKC